AQRDFLAIHLRLLGKFGEIFHRDRALRRRAKHVHANAVFAPFARSDPRETANPFLGCRVNTESDTSEYALAGTEIDDRAAALLHMGKGRLHMIERPVET